MLSRLRSEKKGFTLIELIMVIVILGIVAAVAVPKFLSLRGQATAGVVRGIHGAILGSIQQNHGEYLLDAANTYTAASIAADIDVAGVTMSSTGAANIRATFKARTYDWTYTDASTTDDNPPTIDLSASSDGSATIVALIAEL